MTSGCSTPTSYAKQSQLCMWSLPSCLVLATLPMAMFSKGKTEEAACHLSNDGLYYLLLVVSLLFPQKRNKTNSDPCGPAPYALHRHMTVYTSRL